MNLSHKEASKYQSNFTDVNSPQFFKFLKSECPSLSSYNAKIQDKMCASIAYMVTHPHNTNNDAYSLPTKILKSTFGDNYNDYANQFSEIDDARFSDGVTMARILKQEFSNAIMNYVPQIMNTYSEDIAVTSPIEFTNSINLVNLVSSDNISKRRIPQITVSTYDKGGKRKESNVKFKNNFIRINGYALYVLLNFVGDVMRVGDASLYNKALNPKRPKSLGGVNRVYNYLKVLESISTPNNNGLILTYHEGYSGRLQANESINPQSMNSEIRKVLFSGLDYWDYDISNTNFSIAYYGLYFYFKSVAERYNQLQSKNQIQIPISEFQTIQEYLSDKRKFRKEMTQEWSAAIGHQLDEGIAKGMMIAITGGAKFTALSKSFDVIDVNDTTAIKERYERGKWKSTIFETVNYDIKLYNILRENKKLQALFREWSILTKFIIDVVYTAKREKMCAYKDNGNEYIRNFNNKKLCITDNSIGIDEVQLIENTEIGELDDESRITTYAKNASIIVHLIQGIESKIINRFIEMESHHNSNLSAFLVYDGVTSLHEIKSYKKYESDIISEFRLELSNQFKFEFEPVSFPITFDLNVLKIKNYT